MAVDIQTVEVALEEITYCGVKVGPLTIQMPFTLDSNKVAGVPLRPDVLQYIRVAILAGGVETRCRRKRTSLEKLAPKHSKWIEKRGAFVAKRCVNGEYKYSSFKVGKADDPLERYLAVAKAREDCTGWLQKFRDEIALI